MNENTHTDMVRSYFDDHAQDWHDYYQGVSQIVDLILIDRKEIAVDFLQHRLPEGASVFDAGCGAGITSVELARRGMQVTGVDISEKMISLARQNRSAAGLAEESCSFHVGDLMEDPLPGVRFDCVLALGFLQYQADEAGALARLHALLKPGGIMVISGPMKTTISNYFGLAGMLRGIKRWVLRRPKPPTNRLRTISANYYSVPRFRALLEAAGFNMLDYKGHGYIHFEFLARRMSFRTQVRVHEFFTGLAKWLPIGRFANDIVVIAGKPDAGEA